MTNREKFNQKMLSLNNAELASIMEGNIDTCSICPAYEFCVGKEAADLEGCKEVLVKWFNQETDPVAQRLEMINEDVAKAAEE